MSRKAARPSRPRRARLRRWSLPRQAARLSGRRNRLPSAKTTRRTWISIPRSRCFNNHCTPNSAKRQHHQRDHAKQLAGQHCPFQQDLIMTQAISNTSVTSFATELAELLINNETVQSDADRATRDAARETFLKDAQAQVDALHAAAGASGKRSHVERGVHDCGRGLFDRRSGPEVRRSHDQAVRHWGDRGRHQRREHPRLGEHGLLGNSPQPRTQ